MRVDTEVSIRAYTSASKRQSAGGGPAGGGAGLGGAAGGGGGGSDGQLVMLRPGPTHPTSLGGSGHHPYEGLQLRQLAQLSGQ